MDPPPQQLTSDWARRSSTLQGTPIARGRFCHPPPPWRALPLGPPVARVPRRRSHPRIPPARPPPGRAARRPRRPPSHPSCSGRRLAPGAPVPAQPRTAPVVDRSLTRRSVVDPRPVRAYVRRLLVGRPQRVGHYDRPAARPLAPRSTACVRALWQGWSGWRCR